MISNDGYIIYYSESIQVNTWIYYLYYYKNANKVYKVDIYDAAMKLVKTHSENIRAVLVSWINQYVEKASVVHNQH